MLFTLNLKRNHRLLYTLIHELVLSVLWCYLKWSHISHWKMNRICSNCHHLPAICINVIYTQWQMKDEFFAFLMLLYKWIVSSFIGDHKILDADHWNHTLCFSTFSYFESSFLITCGKRNALIVLILCSNCIEVMLFWNCDFWMRKEIMTVFLIFFFCIVVKKKKGRETAILISESIV